MRAKLSAVRAAVVGLVGAAALVCGATLALAQETKVMALPKPEMTGGRPLMEVLKDRKTIRTISNKPLPAQTLSNLLWAACGVNRPDGRRTAPTAMNAQEIDVYVAMADGLYLFDAKAHALNLVVAKDLRGATGGQPFVREAPVNLIFVADLTKFRNASDETKNFYSATDTGYISQNVYLYCASEGLATVVRGGVPREELSKAMGLRPDQKIILAQTVGYPAQ